MLPFPGKIVVGITGGIACGKSKVCQKFGELGWEVISTDSCSHYFLNKDKIVIKAILEKFGTGIKDLNGNIDKSKLARLIFNSHYDRAWLESLLHPLVRDRWMSAIKLSASSKFVVEVPLLYENNLHAQFTKTISVHVSKSIQIQRLEKRGCLQMKSILASMLKCRWMKNQILPIS